MTGLRWLLRLRNWLLRLGFRFLYNELAWTYDGTSRLLSLGQWHTWQRTAIPYVVGERVLELAFGTGDLLLDLNASGKRPVGIDLSPYMARLARRKLLRHGLPVPLARSRAQALPFADGVFDSLAATFPTQYIIDPLTLAEAWRVLRPGGRLVVVDRCRFLGPHWLSRFVDWLYVITGQRSELRPVLIDRLRAAGFQANCREETVGQSQVSVIFGDKSGAVQ
jgi:ubiquinone/menaquinone biosynthesis C-methylase UbiE